MRYQLVSGFETHVELSTNTKIFCGCTTKFGGAPNTHCCPVCTGQPGALPILNKRVIEYVIKAGLALHCSINTITHLDRKNYCYPDLPKAYQISQYDKPLCEHGYIELDSGTHIRIKRIHIEEDAGKLVHERGETFIDYNRGGVPLLEIVTEPDISSTDEAREYVEKLQLIMRYLGVSDCKMQEGSMRCDINISLKPIGSDKTFTRTEIKNMNSISHIVKAMEYEASRQAELLDDGKQIEQCTLRYDEVTGETYPMRTKEDAQDYRYFPEPDILEVVIKDKFVSDIKESLPELPIDKYNRYVSELKINAQNAKLLYKYKNVCAFLEECLSLGASTKNTVNLIIGIIYSTLATEEDKENFNILITPKQLASLVKLCDEGKINITLTQSTLTKMLESGKDYTAYISESDLKGVDDSELVNICKQAIAQNAKAVQDYKSGKEKAIFALYGFIRKATSGKADMNKANEIIVSLLK